MSTHRAPKPSLPALGGLIRTEREARGMSRRDLVVAAGYTNISKGLNRLDAIERGDNPFPGRELLHNFARPLELEEARLDAAMLADLRALDVPHEPRLIARLMPAVYCRVRGTESMTPEQAEEFAVDYAAAKQRRVCLVLSPVRCVYIEPDGRRSRSRQLPSSTLGVVLERVRRREETEG